MASLWSGSERPFIFLVKDKKRNPFIFGSLVVFVGCKFGSEWCVWITKRQQDEKPNDPCHWMVADTVKPYPLIFITFRLANFELHCQYYIHTEIAFYFWVHPMVNIAMKQLIEKPKVHYTLHEHTRDWVTTRIM